MKAIRNYEWKLDGGQTIRAEITVVADRKDESRLVDGVEVKTYGNYNETTVINLYRDGDYLVSAKEIKYNAAANDKGIVAMIGSGKVMLGLRETVCKELEAIIEATIDEATTDIIDNDDDIDEAAKKETEFDRRKKNIYNAMYR